MEGVIMTWVTVSIVAAAAYFIARKRTDDPSAKWLYWFHFVFPFAYGGFYIYLAAPISAALLIALYQTACRNKKMMLRLNLNTAAIILVVLAYWITPLWATDRGSAVFGMIRMLPLLLYLLLLMQLPTSGAQVIAEPVAYSGALMVLLSVGMQFIPSLLTHVSVNGRLAGFFEYPNTFAVFLLAGLVMLMLKQENTALDWIEGSILIFGVIASGSRAVFLFLLAAITVILIGKRKAKTAAILTISLAAGILTAVLLSHFTELSNADHFTTITSSPGTFIGRLLYYRDALGVILSHPFGLGYWGYRALEGSFQTGRYYVSFVHNGLLQLLLDIGWIPAILLAVCFLKAVFSKKTAFKKRAVLLLVLGHCMLDFDMQYFVIWMLLLPQLDLHCGRAFQLSKPKKPLLTVGSILLAMCIWLGAGDLCVQMGYSQAGLAITPFRTDVLEARLFSLTDPDDLDTTADKILALCPSSSIAHSAKANAAYVRGDVLTMMEEKELAIQYSKYTLAEYTDYLDKLFVVYQLYMQAGDENSAVYCMQKILSIPEMMQQVSANTTRLAEMTGDDNTLALPEDYLDAIEALRKYYS